MLRRRVVDAERISIVESGVLTASDEQWELARSRFAVLAPLAGVDTVGFAAADEAAERLQLSRRQVYSLIDRIRCGSGTVTDLLIAPPSGGRGRGRVSAEVEEVIADYLAKEFLKRQKLSVAAIYRRIALACHRSGLRVPARNTVATRIAAMHPGTVARLRGGQDAARPRQSAGGVPPPVEAVLEQVQIDHTVVDLMIVDEHDREPIGRPYLTMAIDVFSRCVLGFVVTLEPPSAVSVGLCLGRVACDKNGWLEAMGLAGQVQWPMAGKPRRLYLDNAAEFKGEALRRGCEQHGIDLGYRPPGRPHYGGIVERIIGTAMLRVHELPGTTFSDPAARGSYDSQAAAVLTLTELERWLVISTSSYHGSLHSSLGQSPAAKWSDSITTLRNPPPVVVDETAFVVDFLPVIRRRLTRTGFTIDHVQYFSNTLKPWISRREQLGTFVIRRDPRDISRIWVLEPDNGAGYVEVPYRTLSHPAVTLWEHRAAAARLRERGRTQIDESALFSMIEQMREITTGAKKATRTARRNRARRQHLPVPATTSSGAMSTPPPDDPTAPSDVVAAFDDIEQW
ncbi:Mu transposase C-terminal domain-containing protein [Rhodococcus qingshengii]|uniref:Mu transposase C-terminal domain-containing protein n=4 Tax=Actinomycetota TaxID=201174 RepID=UPI001C5E2A20|nr:DDE-type integrase/transposase/recombinase [Rhodococcus qingshengii]